jgi:DNA-binding LacI/PurR family transcriptional regulator
MDTSTDTSSAIYEALADRIRQRIRDGAFKPGQLIGSEHGLARNESISRMTVRRASELLISEGLLERRPGKGLYVRASGRGATRSGTVQVVCGNLLWEPSLQMSRGVQAAAAENGVHVQLYDAHGNVDLDLAMVDQLPEGHARGAVVVSLHSPRFSEAICRLQTRGFPFVLLDHRMHDIDVSSVVADNHSGGYQVGQFLAGLGHERIAFVGDLVAATTRDRLAGLRDAVGDAGLPFRRSLVVDLVAGTDRFGDWSACVADGVRALMALPAPERPTAIACSCDAVARSVYRAAGELGLRVPRDLSVVGYDDDPLAEWLTPRLTTVRQPFEQMGRAAMELLARRMSDPAARPEHRVLPVELVQRGSAGPAADAGA